jgi:hypothetical protein
MEIQVSLRTVRYRSARIDLDLSLVDEDERVDHAYGMCLDGKDSRTWLPIIGRK